MTRNNPSKDKLRKNSASTAEKQTPKIVEIVFEDESGGRTPAGEAGKPPSARKKPRRTSITFDFTNKPG